MGIFTGIETLFFVLGVLTTTAIGGLVYLRQKYPFTWFSTATAGLGIFLGVFTIAWCVSGVLEGEPQSAGLGLLILGVPTLILSGLTRQLVTKELKAVTEH